MTTPLVLALLALSLQNPPPASSTPADDLLRGPSVPQDALKSERERRQGGEKLSRPMLEQRVYFATLDAFAFDDATRGRVKELRERFTASVAAYEKDAEVKRKAIFEKRKREAEPGKPPSDDFKRAMNELEAARPKLRELQAKVDELLSKDDAVALRKAFDDGMKRARAEITRREEEARKRKEAERREKKGEKPEMEKPEMEKPEMEKPG
ncbi:MAG: hypothetical protein RL136_301 [Planctomycetota bacterium]|jgi:hypothetical protein